MTASSIATSSTKSTVYSPGDRGLGGRVSTIEGGVSFPSVSMPSMGWEDLGPSHEAELRASSELGKTNTFTKTGGQHGAISMKKPRNILVEGLLR